MSVTESAAQAWEQANKVRENPYVDRVLNDEKIRDNARVAYENALSAFKRIQDADNPAATLLDDKKLHRDIKAAQENLTAAVTELRYGPRKRRHPIRNILILAILTLGVALVVSEGLRNKVLDLVFGAEEEFDYTSTTVSAPVAPVAPEPVATVNGDVPHAAAPADPEPQSGAGSEGEA